MTPIILDPAAYAAAASAVSQEVQILAAIAPWAGGNVTVHLMENDEIAESSLYGPWSTDLGAPRGAYLGNLISGTVYRSPAPITTVIFLNGTVPIMTVLGSDITFAVSTTQTGRLTNLSDPVNSKMRITANPSLPEV